MKQTKLWILLVVLTSVLMVACNDDEKKSRISEVDKLLHLCRDFFTLLKNFVTLTDFYTKDPDVKAIFQAGTLYIDQRSCDLCIKVCDHPAVKRDDVLQKIHLIRIRHAVGLGEGGQMHHHGKLELDDPRYLFHKQISLYQYRARFVLTWGNLLQKKMPSKI